MPEIIETDVLVIGEGCAGQSAALSASEQGARVTLVYNGKASSTAISTGFLTYAAHEGFSRDDVYQAMAHTTGKGLCDVELLRRLVEDAPDELASAIEEYEIPVDRAPKGVRVRRAKDVRGKDLLGSGYGYDDDKDMTGLMMEYSSTHGTALFSQLRKAVRSRDIELIKGTALTLSPAGLGAWVLVDGQLVKVVSGATILATGGLQGLYGFTDTPGNLLGDGQAMALEIGAELIDMEFIQFYPLTVKEENVPALFLYPDFPEQAKLTNAMGDNLLEKYIDENASLGALHNWDELSTIIQTEIISGQDVFIDFRHTSTADWTPDSLTATFLSKYIPNYQEQLICVAPSAHYTIGGIRFDIHGQTSVPGLYACGEVAGGLHGANRHGGTALVEAITFGRICGRHAADNLQPISHAGRSSEDAPPMTRDGDTPEIASNLKEIRRINQHSLGASRSAEVLEKAGQQIDEVRGKVGRFGWNGLKEFEEVLRLKRVITLSEIMRLSMVQRTESRGTHVRTDYPEQQSLWHCKQIVRSTPDGEPVFEKVAL